VSEAVARASRRKREGLTVGALAWGVLAVVFVALRAGAALGTQVGGAELAGLSGAWQAHVNAGDSRFIPTLFQALAALTFEWTTSEMPARGLAVLAAASIPLAVFRLRGPLGEPGALIALLLLAIDAPGVLFGATATVSGFDLALTAWLFVLATEPRAPAWAWAPAGFLAATSGPVWLPLAVGIGAVRLFRQEYPSRRVLGFTGAGAALGIAAASLRFGMGWDGLRVPPFDALAAGFEEPWSTESTLYLSAIYLAPLIATGAAVAVYELFRATLQESLDGPRVEVLAWAGVAFAWLLASAGTHSPVPLVGLSIPLAFLLGPALARLANTAWAADWTYARYLVPGMLTSMLVVVAFLLEWARDGLAGDGSEKLAVGGLAVVSLGCAGLLAAHRRSIATLVAPAAVVALLPTISGLSGVAFSGPNEPLPSPVSPFQAREIRDIALRARDEQGGPIVIHPRFEAELTWAFRDSGELVFSSGPVPDAAVIIWPADADAPDSYSVLDGEWTVLRERRGPDGEFLDYLRWLANRNTLSVGRVPVIVYLKAGP
jgi:hypothetical protein